MILAEDDHTQVIGRVGTSDYLLCTFAEMEMRPDGVNFWGAALARQLDLSCIGFVAKSRNWYPRASIQALLPKLQPMLSAFNRRLTYGFSMGAHAALRSAASLGASHVLAFSPQFSLDPAVTGPNAWTRLFQPEFHADMAIAPDDVPPAVRAFVLADPMEPVDAKAAAMIRSKVPQVELIRLTCLGHEAMRLFASTAVAERLLAAALEGSTTGLQALADEVRRSPAGRISTYRLQNLARHLRRRRQVGQARNLLRVVLRRDAELKGPKDKTLCELAAAAEAHELTVEHGSRWLQQHPTDHYIENLTTSARAHLTPA